MTVFFGNLSKSSDKTMFNFDTMYCGDYSIFSILFNKIKLFLYGLVLKL